MGQEQVVRHLHRFAAERSVPHLLITGPHGTGKSAAIECLAKALYGDDWAGNTTVLDATSLFFQGKGSLSADERFAHLYRKDESLSANFKRIVRWYASMRPLGAEFKLLVLEGAHSLPREIQQALRRTLERYSATCRFILCTTNQSAIIPAITSRCLPLSFSPVEGPVILATLGRILDEEVPGRRRDLQEEVEMIAHAAGGDLRKATMILQLLVESGKGAGTAEINTSETGNIAIQLVEIDAGEGLCRGPADLRVPPHRLRPVGEGGAPGDPPGGEAGVQMIRGLSRSWGRPIMPWSGRGTSSSR